MQTNLPLITGLAALLAGTALPAEPAKAQVVGTAAAVNPLSQSTPPGRGTRVLHIGAEVLHQERIQTAASGTVQLLFIDKTTLSIGPNSILVIDNYVYDPASGTGQMATSLAKGMLRFVGGQLSHQGAATVRTPAAVVGIRGGIATIAQGAGGTRIINHFGTLTITNGCGTSVIRRTGFAITLADWNSCPEQPERAAQAEINTNLRRLTSKPGQTGGAKSSPTDGLVGRFGIGRTVPVEPDSQPVQQQTTHVENAAFDIILQATQKGALRTVRIPAPRPRPPPGD